MRKCACCNEYKDESEFPFIKKSNRYHSYCKVCKKITDRTWRRLKREQEREERKVS